MDNIENPEEKMCKYCQEVEHPEDMISPCNCIGGMRYVHRKCLNDWRNQNQGNNYFQCRECNRYYDIRRVFWARVFENKWTAIALSIIALASSVYLSGELSSRLVNRVWFWFHHQSYKSPHRLQVLFYGLFLNAIPGAIMGVKSLLNSLRNMPAVNVPNVNLPRFNFPIGYPVYNIYPSGNQHDRDADPSDDEEEVENKENKDRKDNKQKVKKQKVTKYKSPGYASWLLVGSLCASTMYHTFDFVHTKMRSWSMSAGEYIANVN